MSRVLLGISGGIAVYKALDITSRLVKKGITVDIIMTENAKKFVAPLSFEALTSRPVAEMFEGPNIGHINLPKNADVFLIAPATANIIAKLAAGIADDMLSTTVLANERPLIIAPAMNNIMYSSDSVQKNLKILKARGVKIIDPAYGRLACGDIGQGKLADIDDIEDALMFEIQRQQPQILKGKKVLVTAGPTTEDIDPVRFIGNKSSGKMGYEIAKKASLMGAEVCLISGPTNLRKPYNVEMKKVRTTDEMLKVVLNNLDADIIIMAAAPADFKIKEYSNQKIKKTDNLNLNLVRNPDILVNIAKNKKKRGQIIVGFAAETENLMKNANQKLKEKSLDFIVLNDVSIRDSGFASDYNTASIISAEGKIKEFPKMLKSDLAEKILMSIIKE